MLDPKLLRNDPAALAKQLGRRGFIFDIDLFTNLENKRRDIQLKTQELQTQRNQISKAVGQAKAKGENVEQLLTKVTQIGTDLTHSENQLNEIQQAMQNFQWQLPNILDSSVPEGKNEQANVEIRRWGHPPEFDFPVQDHLALGERLGGVDFSSAAKLSGSRFVVLKGPLARLQRALVNL